MTPEQFVFWISGYLTAGKDNDADIIVNDILQAVKTVSNPSMINIMKFIPSEF